MHFKPEFLVNEAFWNKSYLGQMWAFYLSHVYFKSLYYYVFSMNDSSLIVSGLSYNPHPRKGKVANFEKIKNIDEWLIDTG